GHEIGLIGDARYDTFLVKKQNIEAEIDRLKNVRIKPNERAQSVIESRSGTLLKDGILAFDLLKRPEMDYESIMEILEEDIEISKEEYEQVEIQTKYDGYIAKSLAQVEKMKRMENKKIPADIDYDAVHSLATEALDKLKKVKPLDIAQASRSSGVNPADSSMPLVYIAQRNITRVNA